MQLAEFIEFLEDRAGDTVRAVEWYRDDLELEDVMRRAERLHEQLTWERGPHEAAELDVPGGELATVSLRERAVSVHLPVAEDYGVVVGLEPDVARSLHGFVSECRAYSTG